MVTSGLLKREQDIINQQFRRTRTRGGHTALGHQRADV